MAKFIVEVSLTKKVDITAYASNEEEAIIKAEEIVGNWEGVEEVEALSCVKEVD